MASSSCRLPLLPVVVMVMASLLVLLLPLVAAAADMDMDIEMMVNNHNNNMSSSNDYCHYQITVRTSGPVIGSGTDSTLTFYLYDMYGNGVQVSQDGSVWPWFESNRNDVLNIDGPCINRPCNLVVTTDGAGYGAAWLMSWLQVVVTGAPVVEDVTFFNGRPGTDGMEGAWLGPGYTMQLQINNCY